MAHETNRYRAAHFYAEFKRYLGWAGGEPQAVPKPDPAPAAAAPVQPENLAWSLEKN